MSVFVALKEKPEYYEAYVYIVVFDHGKRMKYYLGWHKGKFDGTYKGTPKTHEKEFYNDLRKYDYKVFAIAFGTSQNNFETNIIFLYCPRRCPRGVQTL